MERKYREKEKKGQSSQSQSVYCLLTSYAYILLHKYKKVKTYRKFFYNTTKIIGREEHISYTFSPAAIFKITK